MPTQRPYSRICRPLAIATLALATLAPTRATFGAVPNDPIRVEHRVTIRNGNWIPLPVDDMRRAAADTALSRLSDTGRLQLLDHEDSGTFGGALDAGSLDLEIALIGPAETAKLTITLDVRDSPTLVSTASISVRGLDHAGIYDALEHVGELAADRLAAKLDYLGSGLGGAKRPGTRPDKVPADDPARRRAYDDAQAAKRAGEYEAAQRGFEAIVESATNPNDALRLLAEDELRHGLPLFEAQQMLNQLGRLSLPGQQDRREAALARAENLYRQIQAENPSHVQRVTDAQRALDSLIVVRGAIRNSMRASALARLQGLRMGMMEFLMMEGQCPDRDWVERMASQQHARIALDEVSKEGRRATRYIFSESASGTRITLRCDDHGIEIVGTHDDASGIPAARGSSDS